MPYLLSGSVEATERTLSTGIVACLLQESTMRLLVFRRGSASLLLSELAKPLSGSTKVVIMVLWLSKENHKESNSVG